MRAMFLQERQWPNGRSYDTVTVVGSNLCLVHCGQDITLSFHHLYVLFHSKFSQFHLSLILCPFISQLLISQFHLRYIIDTLTGFNVPSSFHPLYIPFYSKFIIQILYYVQNISQILPSFSQLLSIFTSIFIPNSIPDHVSELSLFHA